MRGVRSIDAGTFWTAGGISREGDGDNTTGLVASWHTGTPNLNCTGAQHWALHVYNDPTAQMHGPGCTADTTSLPLACCSND